MLAPAKINLYLHVSPPRPDGYHELDTLVAFSDYGDELSVAPSDDIELTIEGPFADRLTQDSTENMVLKAARALRHVFEQRHGETPGAAIRLIKNLPIASGIGGGSSDAAATLVEISKLWQLSLDDQELRAIGLQLGADVPACLYGQSAWLSGIGEIIEASPQLHRLPVVLVNPLEPVATADVYGRYDQLIQSDASLSGAERPSAFETPEILLDYLRDQRNDLEPAAKQITPSIDHLLKSLKRTRALLVRMSGSGGTCFGIYGGDGAARAAILDIQQRHPDWWVMATHLQTGIGRGVRS
ncbi:MAG: 4-(cytidine 5'-diphospho)-2-C-methyl-D-erythritol kinase [Alphaproteobacteria bacterium]|nr:MAG: 4-(cytidine 5'-diphospho)-2-C-methyl-D-erythritol kinase [Alphaproteobacteria bacterium]